jgi:hypothetical protein
MKNLSILLVSTFILGNSLPASADWDRIGQVRIQGRNDQAAEAVRFGGAVERLRLTAEGANVNCRSVRAEFGNGREREIFQGALPRNKSIDVDLPGDRRNLRNLSFRCSVQNRGEAFIRVSADVGRYRDEWRRNPDFSRLWGKAFNWGSNLANDWHYIGSEEFSGRDDSESRFAGWRGRHVDAIALKPIEGDARCSRVVAQFRNGRERALDVNGGDTLRQGQYYKLDMPGGYRDLESLSMRCHPTNNRRVNIQLFTSN